MAKSLFGLVLIVAGCAAIAVTGNPFVGIAIAAALYWIINSLFTEHPPHS